MKQRRPARDGLGAVLNAEASNLQAVVEKHVVENMVSRLEKWARAVVTAAAAHIDDDQAWQQQQQQPEGPEEPEGLRLPRGDLKATETKALVGAVRRALYSPAGQVLAPYTLTGKVRQAWLDRIVQQLQLAVQSPLGQALHSCLSARDSSEEWWRLLICQYLILRHLHDPAQQHHQQQGGGQGQQQQAGGQGQQHVLLNNIHLMLRKWCHARVVALPGIPAQRQFPLAKKLYRLLLSPADAPQRPRAVPRPLWEWALTQRAAHQHALRALSCSPVPASARQWAQWRAVRSPEWQGVLGLWKVVLTRVPRARVPQHLLQYCVGQQQQGQQGQQRQQRAPATWGLIPDPGLGRIYIHLTTTAARSVVSSMSREFGPSASTAQGTTGLGLGLGPGSGPAAAPPQPNPWVVLFPAGPDGTPPWPHTKNSVFAGHVSTDGVGASVLMRTSHPRLHRGKDTGLSAPKRREAWEKRHQGTPACLAGKLCVGVDPGAKATTAATADLRRVRLRGEQAVQPLPARLVRRSLATARVFSQSTKAFHVWAGTQARKQWQERGLREWPGLMHPPPPMPLPHQLQHLAALLVRPAPVPHHQPAAAAVAIVALAALAAVVAVMLPPPGAAPPAHLPGALQLPPAALQQQQQPPPVLVPPLPPPPPPPLPPAWLVPQAPVPHHQPAVAAVMLPAPGAPPGAAPPAHLPGALQQQQQPPAVLVPPPLQPLAPLQTLQQWVTGIPSVRGPVTAASVRHHLWYLSHRLEDALAHFASVQQRKRRWRCFIQRQRAMHRTVRALCGHAQPQKVVVAWGNGSSGRGSCIRRGWAFPQLEFHRVLRSRGYDVRVVDEYLTSQVCASSWTWQTKPGSWDMTPPPHDTLHLPTAFSRAELSMLCPNTCAFAVISSFDLLLERLWRPPRGPVLPSNW